MTNKRIWPVLAIVFGILIIIIGGLFIAAYVQEAIIKRVGDPDQSLLFWYLPFLFTGFIGLIIGTVSAIWGALRLKKMKRGNV